MDEDELYYEYIPGQYKVYAKISNNGINMYIPFYLNAYVILVNSISGDVPSGMIYPINWIEPPSSQGTINCVNGNANVHCSWSINNVLENTLTITSVTTNYYGTITNLTSNACDISFSGINSTFSSQFISINTTIRQPLGNTFTMNFNRGATFNYIAVGPTIRVKYNVTSTSEMDIFYGDSGMLASMKVDNVSVTIPTNKKYTFSTTGDHYIDYEFTRTYNSNTNMASAFFRGITSIISAEVDGFSSGISYTFYECSNLERVVLNISSIGAGAFDGCTKLSSITINKSTAPTIYSSTWGSGSSTAGVNSGTVNVLYVPTGATGYDTMNWTEYLLNASYGNFTVSATL